MACYNGHSLAHRVLECNVQVTFLVVVSISFPETRNNGQENAVFLINQQPNMEHQKYSITVLTLISLAGIAGFNRDLPQKDSKPPSLMGLLTSIMVVLKLYLKLRMLKNKGSYKEITYTTKSLFSNHKDLNPFMEGNTFRDQKKV